MLEGQHERQCAEADARRIIRREEGATEKQLDGWRKDLGDDAVEALLAEQGL